jgi:lipid II:glycine glycyltransferase (peptidoglycan interpeptide bridge formation enzyme)
MTDYGHMAAKLFHMDERTWERHASPWSVWTRIASLPLLLAAVWSHAWLGIWAFVPMLLVILWLWLNPRLFSAPGRTDTWSATQVKEGMADPVIKRLTEMPSQRADPVGACVSRQLRDAGWLPQSPEDGFGAGHPQFTFEIPLAGRTEDALLRGMNQLWRRNIKKAANEGVEVTVGEDLKAFHDLYVHTAERDRFTPRPLHYFETMFAVMSAEEPERIRLYLARHEGDLVAAAVMVRSGAHAWYTYGASSTDKREVRGSNACQWAMIRDALAAGCDVYNLRGITPTLDAGDPHVGLIQFKVGTGGEAVRYVGEWDLPLRPTVYWAFDLYMRRRESIRRRGR